jgi:predicted enzyme related to lactoylglutathione lyase
MATKRTKAKRVKGKGPKANGPKAGVNKRPAKAKVKAKAKTKARPAPKALEKKAAAAKRKTPARPAAAAAATPAAPAAPAALAAPIAPKISGPGVVHWEVQARDAPAQQRFYGELFGWAIDASNPMGYGMVKGAGGSSIGGGIGSTMDTPRATFYVWVPSIAAALEKAVALGGHSVMPRTDLGMVVMGQFRDPEGNVIGLVEGAS